MRKLVAILGAGALMLVSGTAMAAAGPKATGGVGWTNAAQGFDARATFTAQPDDLAKGTFRIELSGSQNWWYQGEVTCYNQSGNMATFSGVVTASEGAGDPTTFKATVQDGGQGSQATGPDRIATQRNASGCSSHLPTLQDVTTGNLQVHE